MRRRSRKIDILARRPGSTSRISEPVTGRQERPNSSTRSHDPITDIWKEIRHDYLEETSGCACLGARRDRAGIAKLRPGSRPPHRRGARGRPSGLQLLQRLRLGLCLSGLYGSTRAPPSDAAMSDVERPAMLSEVRFILIL